MFPKNWADKNGRKYRSRHDFIEKKNYIVFGQFK